MSCTEHRTVIITAEDCSTLRRWSVAIDANLIALEGKATVDRRTGMITLRYQCAMPEEWLLDAISAASKREYNVVLERIRKGDAWLKENEQHPLYASHFNRFVAMFDDLKELYNAISETLDDPMTGYEGVAQCQ